MVLPCFDDALLRGAGEEPSAARASERFVKLLSDEKRILRSARPDNLAGLAVLRDPIDVNYWLNTGNVELAHKRLQPLRPYKANPEERALLRYLGSRLTCAAARTLPRACLGIAEKWKTAAVDERIELIRGLLPLLRYKTKTRSIREQIETQRAEFVLPFEYRTSRAWNCLGSFQRLHAFCRFAGIRSFVSIPIEHSENAFYGAAMPHARRLLDILNAAPGAANRVAAESIGAWIKRIEDMLAAPSWLHFGAILDLGGDCWALADPSARQFGVFRGSDTAIARKIRFFERYRRMFPGLKILHRSREGEPKLARVVEGFVEVVRTVEEYARSAADSSISPDELSARIPERIIELQEKYQGSAFAGSHSAKQFEIAARLAVKSASRGVDEPEAAEYSSWFARLGAQMCANEYMFVRERDLVHPMLELGDAEYTMAVSTLGHLAWCMNRSDEARRVLVNHCGSQFRLLYYAGLALERDCGEPALRVERACARLRGYRSKLRNSVEFLAQLERNERAS